MKTKRSGTSARGASVNGQTGPAKKVFIVEDHPVFREGLIQILKWESDLELCGAAGTVREAGPAIARLKPDIVLVDITLPGKSGLDLIREIRARDRRVKLLVVSMHDEALYASRVLRMGGDGYIMKQEDPTEIIHAVRDVLAGHIYVSEEVLAGGHGAAKGRRPESERPLAGLSDQELEILEHLGQGKSNAEIARDVGLSIKNVGAALELMRKKLKLKTANALIRYAVCWVEEAKG